MLVGLNDVFNFQISESDIPADTRAFQCRFSYFEVIILTKSNFQTVTSRGTVQNCVWNSHTNKF